MNIRRISLLGGPSDGLEAIASHGTAIVDGEIYIWNGEPGETFVHAKTLLASLPMEQHDKERARVDDWRNRSEQIVVAGKPFKLPAPMSELIGIPPWRINAWLQVLRAEDNQ